MKRQEIFDTIQEVPSSTRVKAWMFTVDEKFYHVASYSGYRIGDRTSVWESDKKGRRTTQNPIFTVNGNDHLACVGKFLDKMEENVPAQ